MTGENASRPSAVDRLEQAHLDLGERLAGVAEVVEDRRAVLGALLRDLVDHVAAESRTLPEALRRLGRPDLAERLQVDHRALQGALVQVDRGGLESPALPRFIEDLQRNFQAHVVDADVFHFPLLRGYLTESEAAELAERLGAGDRPGPTGPAGPPGG